MTQAPTILLADARQAGHLLGWLRSAYAFYVHDLSEFDPERYHLTSGGRWEPDYLSYWLEQPFCRPLVALADGLPIGFAFVGQPPFPFMSPSCDFHLGEFFVLRSHRRSGLGRAVAITVFSQLPGLWELRVLPRNTPAAKFWRSVIPRVSTGAPKEASDAQGVQLVFSTADILSGKKL
ncbi:MAG: GNAT family N-acetyltransferase [Thermoanaerobaculia bacterium]